MNATFDTQGRRTDATSILGMSGSTVIVSFVDGFWLGKSNHSPYVRLTVTGADGKTTYAYLDETQALKLAEAMTFA